MFSPLWLIWGQGLGKKEKKSTLHLHLHLDRGNKCAMASISSLGEVLRTDARLFKTFKRCYLLEDNKALNHILGSHATQMSGAFDRHIRELIYGTSRAIIRGVRYFNVHFLPDLFVMCAPRGI